MPVRIYHNPRCNTSRKTLALLREKGVEPEIVEYLKTPYTAAQLKILLGQLKMPAKALLRKKEAAEAGIDPAKLSEDQLITTMAKHPIVVERRNFLPDRGVRLAGQAPGLERRQQVDPLRRAERLEREDGLDVGRDLARALGTVPAHAVVVLLVGRGRQ